MHYNAERNERRSRRHALVLAIALHLALAAVLYLYTGGTNDVTLSDTVHTEKQAPKSRAVSRP